MMVRFFAVRYMFKMWLAAIPVALIVVLPFLIPPFYILFLIRIMIFSLLTLSFTFFAKHLGLFSFMQATIAGLSAYSFALFQKKVLLITPFAELSALSLSILIMAILAFALIRTRGVYFLLLSLILAICFWGLALQWVSVSGGTTGIIGLKRPSLFYNLRNFYYLVLFITMVLYAIFCWLEKSNYGLILRGIKNNERKMKSLGYNTNLYVYTSLLLITFPAAVSGILTVYDLGLINAYMIGIDVNLTVLLASMIGGIEKVVFAIPGAIIYKILDTFVIRLTQHHLLISGLLFIIVVLLRGRLLNITKTIITKRTPAVMRLKTF